MPMQIADQMNPRQVLQSATSHLTSNDLVGLCLAATLLGPLSISMFGYRMKTPLDLPAPVLLLGLVLSVAIIYLAGVKARNDLTRARLYWELAVLIPLSFLFGWLVDWRTDPYFTPENLYQVSAILLGLSVLGGLLERRAAKGTPSDVLATATSSTAAIGLALFWVMLSAGNQPVSAILMLLSGILIVLALLLRLPGAIVPIYQGTWRMRWRRRKSAKE